MAWIFSAMMTTGGLLWNYFQKIVLPQTCAVMLGFLRIAKALAVEPATLKHRGRFLGVGGSAESMMLNTGAELHSRLAISLID
jgi:hypothetical protein